MKFIITTTLLLIFQSFVLAQQTWNELPINPHIPTAFSVFDREVAILNNDVYTIYVTQDNPSPLIYSIRIDKYDQSLGNWFKVDSISNIQNIRPKIKTSVDLAGQTIYIAAYIQNVSNRFEFLNYTPLGGLSPISISPPSSSSSTILLNPNTINPGIAEWTYLKGNINTEHYVLFQSLSTAYVVYLGHLNGVMQATNVTTTLNPTVLTMNNFQLKESSNGLYFAVSNPMSNEFRIGKFNAPSTITSILTENTSTTVNETGNFAIVGNQTTTDLVGMNSSAIYQNDLLPNSGINSMLPAVGLPSFPQSPQYITVQNRQNFSFIFGNYNTSLGSSNAQYNVYRKDYSLQPPSDWEQVGGLIESFPFVNNNEPLFSHVNGTHMALNYSIDASSPYTYKIKVLNQAPFENPNTTVYPSNICLGQENLLVTLGIKDNDNDVISNLFLSGNVNVSMLRSVYLYTENKVSFFQIYGVPSAFNYSLNATFSDGFGSPFTEALAPTILATAVIPVTLSNPAKFCANETNLALSQFTNTPNGVFSVNGQEVSGFLDGSTLTGSTGNYSYSVLSGGCVTVVSAVYELVQPPSMSISAPTLSDCSTQINLSAVINAGSTGTYSYLWNTGATTANVAGLSVSDGPFVCMATDNNNCKATAYISNLLDGVFVTSNSINPSCPGTATGEASVSGVTGVSVIQSVLWSNGASGNSINELSAGTYVALVTLSTGCVVSTEVTLTDPATPTAQFTTVISPSCGIVTNGSISATLTNNSGYSIAWSNGASTPTISGLDNGNYYLELIQNSNPSCFFKFPVSLSEQNSMVISDSIVQPNCNLASGKILVNLTPPLTAPTLTAVSTSWSNGEFGANNVGLYDGDYSIQVTASNGCMSNKLFTLTPKPPKEQPICIVTVDSTSTTNVIVWEKVETSGIEYYKIYREDYEAGISYVIDTVHFSNNSIFNDVVADADNRSWRYRLSAVNTCGIEGPISVAKKTIHLVDIDASDNIANLVWNGYEGNTIANYEIYRTINGGPYVLIASPIPATLPSVNMYIDNASNSTADYFVDVNLVNACEPTIGKANRYNSSRSNRKGGIMSPGDGTGDSNNGLEELANAGFTLYPNPTTGDIFVNNLNLGQATILVKDLTGKTLKKVEIGNGNSIINITELSNGMYILEVQSVKGNHDLKWQKQ